MKFNKERFLFLKMPDGVRKFYGKVKDFLGDLETDENDEAGHGTGGERSRRMQNFQARRERRIQRERERIEGRGDGQTEKLTDTTSLRNQAMDPQNPSFQKHRDEIERAAHDGVEGVLAEGKLGLIKKGRSFSFLRYLTNWGVRPINSQKATEYFLNDIRIVSEDVKAYFEESRQPLSKVTEALLNNTLDGSINALQKYADPKNLKNCSLLALDMIEIATKRMTEEGLEELKTLKASKKGSWKEKSRLLRTFMFITRPSYRNINLAMDCMKSAQKTALQRIELLRKGKLRQMHHAHNQIRNLMESRDTRGDNPELVLVRRFVDAVLTNPAEFLANPDQLSINTQVGDANIPFNWRRVFRINNAPDFLQALMMQDEKTGIVRAQSFVDRRESNWTQYKMKHTQEHLVAQQTGSLDTLDEMQTEIETSNPGQQRYAEKVNHVLCYEWNLEPASWDESTDSVDDLAEDILAWYSPAEKEIMFENILQENRDGLPGEAVMACLYNFWDEETKAKLKKLPQKTTQRKLAGYIRFMDGKTGAIRASGEEGEEANVQQEKVANFRIFSLLENAMKMKNEMPALSTIMTEINAETFSDRFESALAHAYDFQRDMENHREYFDRVTKRDDKTLQTNKREQIQTIWRILNNLKNGLADYLEGDQSRGIESVNSQKTKAEEWLKFRPERTAERRQRIQTEKDNLEQQRIHLSGTDPGVTAQRAEITRMIQEKDAQIGELEEKAGETRPAFARPTFLETYADVLDRKYDEIGRTDRAAGEFSLPPLNQRIFERLRDDIPGRLTQNLEEKRTQNYEAQKELFPHIFLPGADIELEAFDVTSNGYNILSPLLRFEHLHVIESETDPPQCLMRGKLNGEDVVVYLSDAHIARFPSETDDHPYVGKMEVYKGDENTLQGVDRLSIQNYCRTYLTSNNRLHKAVWANGRVKSQD